MPEMLHFTPILSRDSLGDGEISGGKASRYSSDPDREVFLPGACPEVPQGSTLKRTINNDRDIAACKANGKALQLGRRSMAGGRRPPLAIDMDDPRHSLAWSQLVDALSSDSPFATDTRSRLGSKLPKWVYRALCVVLPSQPEYCLPGSAQRAAFLFKPLTRYLGQVLDFKWPSSIYLAEEDMKYLKLSGKYMSSFSARTALRIKCNNEWCIASARATVHQREIVKRLWDLARDLYDFERQESWRKFALIKKLRDAIGILDTRTRQQDDARKVEQELIHAFNVRVGGLVSVRQALEKTVSLQQDRLKQASYTIAALQLALDDREGQSAEALAGMRAATAVLIEAVDTKGELETLQAQNQLRERQERFASVRRIWNENVRLRSEVKSVQDLELEIATLKEQVKSVQDLEHENAILQEDLEEMNAENEELTEEIDRLKENHKKEKGPDASTTKGKVKKKTGKTHDAPKAAGPSNTLADTTRDAAQTDETLPDKVPVPTITPRAAQDFPALPGARPDPFDVQATQLLQRIKARVQKMIDDLDNTKAVRFGEAWGVVSAMEQVTRRAKDDIDKEIAWLLATRNLKRS